MITLVALGVQMEHLLLSELRQIGILIIALPGE